ncbi:MAG: CusA/CzcA family heavy metal efflux RND transporter [Leptospira sp.]|nr:CusA/CzcA family heavy metal efflux RND transporter [Leptospira sp.]
MEILTYLVRWSLNNRPIILFLTFLLVLFGINSATKIKIDAVPDITNIQVQIITTSPSLSALEIEQYITYPVERAISGTPKLIEVRSVSRYGFSLITAVFEDGSDLLNCRQLISEKLQEVSSLIPKNFGTPQIAPITTGLGEIFQFTLEGDEFDHIQKTTYLNWLINPMLKTVPGIVEVNTFGGKTKEFQILANHQAMSSLGVSFLDIAEAIVKNNSSTGSGYLEKNKEQLIISSDGLIKNIEDIQKIQISQTKDGFPIQIKSVARIEEGFKLRKGAATANGKGEVVGAVTLMLIGQNSLEVTGAVKEKILSIQKTLPIGLKIVPYYDRTIMVSNSIQTVIWNLSEGAILVIIILFVMIGDIRSGLVIASIIPLAMLFALGMMHLRDLPANLMSMGAIDFGLIVDGAVILIENSHRRLLEKGKEFGRQLTQSEKQETILNATIEVRKATIFGEIIIGIVYIPIFVLGGTEGKMFIPMATTVLFALLGAFFLTLTIIPVLASYLLKSDANSHNETLFFHKILTWYSPKLNYMISNSKVAMVTTVLIFVSSIVMFIFMGGEFLPKLDEGNLLIEITRLPSSSLQNSIDTSLKIEKLLLNQISEITGITSRTGSPELAVEPMGIDKTDVYLELKPRKEWSQSKEELETKISNILSEQVPEVSFGISQPIEMRNNEIMAGIRADVGIKIYGDDLQKLKEIGESISENIRNEKGVTDLRIEQLSGLEYLRITPNRNKLARYGQSVKVVNDAVETISSGHMLGVVYEGMRRFDIVLKSDLNGIIENIKYLPINLSNGQNVPLSELSDIRIEDGPVQINHQDQNRIALVQFNIRGNDMLSTVKNVKKAIDKKVIFPPGYRYELGGEFQKFQSAVNTLIFVVPVTLMIILFILYLAFQSWKPSLIIFLNVPLAVTGGIFALSLRQMPFSISAGIGFIALFGIAVLNGLVLVTFVRQLEVSGKNTFDAVLEASNLRLRPVLTTALLASIGFIPMAISTSPGAEVQRPLATVVIGGLVTSSFLTLFILPIVYLKFSAKNDFILSKDA